MMDLTLSPSMGGASLPALVQLHCPRLTISRGETVLFMRSRDLGSHPIHLFSKNLLKNYYMLGSVWVCTQGIEPNMHAF